MFIRRIQIFVFILFLPGVVEARTLDELKVSYEVKMLELKNKHTRALDKLVTGYLGALERVQKKFQEGGRLGDVLKVTKEKEDLKNKAWPLPKLEKSLPADLVKLRKVYEKTRILVERENATAIVEVAIKMDGLLEKQTETLTKAGRIAQAKKAKVQRETIAADPKIVSSKNLLERVRLDQNAPVAMRIRRSGDHLEVLVRFDKSGDFSMDSPVENVVEITGGKKQKGETKATVLGEFVGAKGYQVDPYVAFESDLDDVLTPPMQAVSLEVKPGVTYEERKCLRIKMGPVAPNPRIEWPNLLEPETSASVVKLNFHYLIPLENQKLRGFAFHQGLLAPLDGQVMTTRGRWVGKSIVAESVNNNANLRFYFEGLSGGGKTFNGGNEVVYLDDLKVTFQQFSAHSVATYKEGKVASKPVTDAEAQKSIILSGRLISQN